MKGDTQIENELRRVNKLEDVFDNLIKHFSSKYYGAIQKPQLFDALLLVLPDKWERPGDLWDIEIEFEEAIELLADFDFETVLNKIETASEILPQNLIMDQKVWIKLKNITWVIHKSDADPFPSNPHAHQLDNKIKLDLSNGNCYRGKKHEHTMKKKELLLLREKAAKVFKGNLPSLTI